MRQDFLPFARPAINDDDIDAVIAVMRSGWVAGGPRAEALERQFAESVGAGGAVTVSSGTAGMQLVLAAMGIGPGDEVITPSMTWVSTINLVVLAGATPVFCDVDRDTLHVTAEHIEPLITQRTRAIIPVHFAGAPVDLDAIRSMAVRHGVTVIEDAAHALGATYRSVPVGRQGTAVFSLHAIKNVTTGEGGVVCSDDSALLDRVRRLRFHGLGADAFDRETQGRAPQAQVVEPGYKLTLPDLNAAMGIGQLGRLREINAKRAELAGLYLRHLADIPGVLPLGKPEYEHGHAWHLFIVRIDPQVHGCTRDEFMARLKDQNIGTGIHFRAVHRQQYYRERIKGVSLPDTEWNSERIVSLPLFPDMSTGDVDDVIEAITAALCARA